MPGLASFFCYICKPLDIFTSHFSCEMLPDSLVAGISTILLALFAFVSLHNVFRLARAPKRSSRPSTVRPSEGPYIYLSIVGTIIFGVGSLLFPFIVFSSPLSFLNETPFRVTFPYDSIVQIAGLTLLGIGYFVFSWSIVARGRYAVSWDMPEDHKLVTWGPYRYVRHPSYLAYCILFLGLPLTWLNLFAVPCLIGVPGYYNLVGNEEKILVERFGEEYRKYQEKTGKFLPRLVTRQN